MTREQSSGRRALSSLSIDEVLVPGLREGLGGFEVIESDLELGGGLRADLVGVDGGGRIVMVLLTSGRGSKTVLLALDAHARVRRDLELIARHLDSPRIRPELPPRIVLVARCFSGRVIERLMPLLSRTIDAMEVHTLASSEGERTYLVPVGPPGAVGLASATNDTPETFIEALPEDLAELARSLIERMERMDEEVEAAASRTAVSWSLGGQAFARLALAGSELRGSVPARAEDRPIHSRVDAELFLDDALAGYAGMLGLGELDEEEGAREPIAELLPHVLTPEEIEAFRE